MSATPRTRRTPTDDAETRHGRPDDHIAAAVPAAADAAAAAAAAAAALTDTTRRVDEIMRRLDDADRRHTELTAIGDRRHTELTAILLQLLGRNSHSPRPPSPASSDAPDSASATPSPVPTPPRALSPVVAAPPPAPLVVPSAPRLVVVPQNDPPVAAPTPALHPPPAPPAPVPRVHFLKDPNRIVPPQTVTLLPPPPQRSEIHNPPYSDTSGPTTPDPSPPRASPPELTPFQAAQAARYMHHALNDFATHLAAFKPPFAGSPQDISTGRGWTILRLTTSSIAVLRQTLLNPASPDVTVSSRAFLSKLGAHFTGAARTWWNGIFVPQAAALQHDAAYLAYFQSCFCRTFCILDFPEDTIHAALHALVPHLTTYQEAAFFLPSFLTDLEQANIQGASAAIGNFLIASLPHRQLQDVLMLNQQFRTAARQADTLDILAALQPYYGDRSVSPFPNAATRLATLTGQTRQPPPPVLAPGHIPASPIDTLTTRTTALEGQLTTVSHRLTAIETGVTTIQRRLLAAELAPPRNQAPFPHPQPRGPPPPAPNLPANPIQPEPGDPRGPRQNAGRVPFARVANRRSPHPNPTVAAFSTEAPDAAPAADHPEQPLEEQSPEETPDDTYFDPHGEWFDPDPHP